MHVTTYTDAAAFLERTQSALEVQIIPNSLMLGICLKLRDRPDPVRDPLCFRTVEDETGLILSAIKTPGQNLIVVGHLDPLQPAAGALAKDLLAGGWELPGVFGPGTAAATFAQQWSQESGQAYALRRRERVWELREVQTPVPGNGHLRRAQESDVETLTRWWCDFHASAFGRDAPENTDEIVRWHINEETLYVWDRNGDPVSTAISTHPILDSISVSVVYTPPELRGCGYATACVGELSRRLLNEGWASCSLFTDLANPISNHIYEKIGYRPVCDYEEYKFKP
ncbi:MAG: GNAT family N-acetyltransferase [Anaerolineae bacterium]|nr:GNAT family N-acetyltransferase [Anaerolineae bacterium]